MAVNGEIIAVLRGTHFSWYAFLKVTCIEDNTELAGALLRWRVPNKGIFSSW